MALNKMHIHIPRVKTLGNSMRISGSFHVKIARKPCKQGFCIFTLIFSLISQKKSLARILSIDYGMKRTGLAVTDPMQIIANSIGTIETPTLMQFLRDYFKKESVERVIIGLPKQMNNAPSQSTGMIEEFVAAFKKEFPTMPIEYVDERFTSKMAVQTMIDGGVKKKDRRDKALVDSISATIILQSYLESLQYRQR